MVRATVGVEAVTPGLNRSKSLKAPPPQVVKETLGRIESGRWIC
jgi:hypothetical protein